MPPTLRLILARFHERQGVDVGESTASETGMRDCMREINQATADPGFVHRSMANLRGRMWPLQDLEGGAAMAALGVIRLHGVELETPVPPQRRRRQGGVGLRAVCCVLPLAPGN